MKEKENIVREFFSLITYKKKWKPNKFYIPEVNEGEAAKKKGGEREKFKCQATCRKR